MTDTLASQDSGDVLSAGADKFTVDGLDFFYGHTIPRPRTG